MLDKYKLNPFKLSKDIKLSQSAVRLISLGKTRISVPVALRLAKYFNTNPEYWLVLQMRYEIAEAQKDKALMDIVRGIPDVKKAAAAEKAKAAKKTSRATKAAAEKKAPAKRGRKPAEVKAKAGKSKAAVRGRPRSTK
jgi:addiction module HigA family antidote